MNKIVNKSLNLLKRADAIRLAYEITKDRTNLIDADLDFDYNKFDISTFISKSGDDFNFISRKIPVCRTDARYNLIGKAVFNDGSEYVVCETSCANFNWIANSETKKNLKLDFPTTLDLEKDIYLIADCDKEKGFMLTGRHKQLNLVKKFLCGTQFSNIADISHDYKLSRRLYDYDKLLNVREATQSFEAKMLSKQQEVRETDPFFDKEQPEYFNIIGEPIKDDSKHVSSLLCISENNGNGGVNISPEKSEMFDFENDWKSWITDMGL